MHNTQIYSHSFYAVVGTIFGASLACFTLLVFLQFHFYLFVGGIPPFARGGNLTHGDECFDFYDCTTKMCAINGTSFLPREIGCDDTIDAYIDRLPAWMIPEYKKFEVIFWRSVALIVASSISYCLFPLICGLLWKFAYSPLVIRNISRIFDVIILTLSFAACFVIKAALDQLNIFRPNLVWWMEDAIEMSSKFLLIITFGEAILISGGVIYNNYVQTYPDIVAFDPLSDGNDDTMNWRKER